MFCTHYRHVDGGVVEVNDGFGGGVGFRVGLVSGLNSKDKPKGKFRVWPYSDPSCFGKKHGRGRPVAFGFICSGE